MDQSEVIVRFCSICGGAMQFDLERMDDEERALFDKGIAQHPAGRCKGEVTLPTHTYRVQVQVFRDDEGEPLAMVAHTEEAFSFETAVDALSDGLNTKWLRLCDSAELAEKSE